MEIVNKYDSCVGVQSNGGGGDPYEGGGGGSRSDASATAQAQSQVGHVSREGVAIQLLQLHDFLHDD